MSAVLSLPSEATNAQDGDELLHVVCCDPNVALCGADVSRDPWRAGETSCQICGIADAGFFPCSGCVSEVAS